MRNSVCPVMFLANCWLERDDKEAIDKSNLIQGDRLRHAKPAAGRYQEKEEDDLPAEAQ